MCELILESQDVPKQTVYVKTQIDSFSRTWGVWWTHVTPMTGYNWYHTAHGWWTHRFLPWKNSHPLKCSLANRHENLNWCLNQCVTPVIDEWLKRQILMQSKVSYLLRTIHEKAYAQRNHFRVPATYEPGDFVLVHNRRWPKENFRSWPRNGKAPTRS